MNLPDLQERASRLVKDNASSILTAGGVVGTVATAVLTGRATFKAAALIAAEDQAWEEKREELEYDSMGEMHTKDKVKFVWRCYVPPVLVGSATIGSIVMANRVSAQRAAALAAAYGLSEGRLKEYKEKVAEKLTGPKTQAIDDEIAQDRVNANPPNNEVIILAGGDVLCHDLYTGRYFQCTVEQIKRAEAQLNQELFDSQMVSLSSFYEQIGLPATNMSDQVGWNSLEEGAIEMKLTTTMTPDQKPCIAIDFSRPPSPMFNKIHS